MAYQKNTWASGDVVTSAKLNNIEDGIAGGGVLVIGLTYDSGADVYHLDKTWKEIHDASFAIIVDDITEERTQLEYISIMMDNLQSQGEGFTIETFKVGGDAVYSGFWLAESEDGYPAMM